MSIETPSTLDPLSAMERATAPQQKTLGGAGTPAGGRRWSCLTLQPESERPLWHLSRPGHRVHPVPLGLPLIPLGCSPCQALFNQRDAISCFHPSCPRHLLVLHPRAGEPSFPRWGGGQELCCIPHFPSRYLLGASGARSKEGAAPGNGAGFTREIKMAKTQTKRTAGQVASPCTGLSQTVATLDGKPNGEDQPGVN